MLTKFQRANVFIYPVHLTFTLKRKSPFIEEFEEHIRSLKFETKIRLKINVSTFKYIAKGVFTIIFFS